MNRVARSTIERLRHPGDLLTAARRDLGLLRRGVGMVIAVDPPLVRRLSLLILISGLIPVAQPWLTRAVVNALTAGDTQAAMLTGLALVAALTIPGWLEPLRDRLTTSHEERTIAAIETRVIGAGRDLADLNMVERPSFHDMHRRVPEAVSWITSAVWMVNDTFTGTITLVGILLSLGVLHPLIPVSLLLAGAVNQIVNQRFTRLEWQAIHDRAREGREMDYALRSVTQPTTAAEVRVFGLSEFFRARFMDRAEQAYGAVHRVRKRHFAAIMATSLLYLGAIAGAFWYVADRAAGGRFSPGDVAFYMAAIAQAQAATWAADRALMTLGTVSIRLRYLLPFLDDAGPRIAVPPAGEGLQPPAHWERGVTFDRVSFTYPETERAVLTDLSVQLPAGQVTALVGENGAGKSTLVKLLSRMYDPTEGEIRLDGEPYAAYDLAALRARLTVVYQDATRFGFTLADNIALANRDFTWADPEPGRARAATLGDTVGIDRIAATLTKGYDQMLTHWFEGGVELSGGQWQLVAFGRGLMRDDAALAILDEPSSALDAERERDQIAQIRAYAARHERAVLLISHRLSTVRWADQIVVMDDGHVVERGSHEELVTAGGAYADLFTMQASRYREE